MITDDNNNNNTYYQTACVWRTFYVQFYQNPSFSVMGIPLNILSAIGSRVWSKLHKVAGSGDL